MVVFYKRDAHSLDKRALENIFFVGPLANLSYNGIGFVIFGNRIFEKINIPNSLSTFYDSIAFGGYCKFKF